MNQADYKTLQLVRFKLMAAQCSSCTCLTKTFLPEHHAETCTYRQLNEISELVCDVLKNNQEQK